VDPIIEEAAKEIGVLCGIGVHDSHTQKKIAAIIENAIAQDKKQTRERLCALWGEGVS